MRGDMPTLAEIIGANVKHFRKLKGFTSAEALAIACDRSTGNIKKMETGNQGLSEDLIAKVAEVLGVSQIDLAQTPERLHIVRLDPTLDQALELIVKTCKNHAALESVIADISKLSPAKLEMAKTAILNLLDAEQLESPIEEPKAESQES